MVKESEVAPFSGMLAAPKTLLINGGETTVMKAFDVLPVPPCVEVTCTLLFFTPADAPDTFSEMVHEALAASVPAESEATDEPATAPVAPPQVFAKLLGVAMISPGGRLSVNAIPVNATAEFGFVTVNVSEVAPFSGIAAAPNALAIVGGEATVRLAEAVLPAPPLVALTAPEVFVYWPGVVPVIFNTKMQEEFTAMPAAVRLKLVEPATAVAVPAQVFDKPFGVEITRPAGNESVKATPVSATVFAAGLVTVKFNSEVPFKEIVAGLNVAAKTGGVTTTCGLPVSAPVLPMKSASPA
jgi:hypothetical protein